jgi:radical SAM superfamily enzyme YgiQ (UPF0313 family)
MLMGPRIRRILLIWPEFEPSFWGMKYGLSHVAKRAVIAPLALITVAAMLPREKFEFRHVDLNCHPLRDEDIEWADLVMLSGWGPQILSILRAAFQCKRLKKPTLMGGPLATEYPQALSSIDYLFAGEVEATDLEGLVDAIARGTAPRVTRGSDRPKLNLAHLMPRYELLRMDDYWAIPLQHARGCPFTCEFCDIIELYGRVPRLKAPGAVVSELTRIYELGFRGPIVFVDDNFYGNRKACAEALEAIATWQAAHDFPFYFWTQVSVNVSSHPEVLAAMRAAGFYAVFLGIETPSKEALAETKKVQNLKVDLIETIERIHSYQIYAQAGFILGFDNDAPGIAEMIIDFIEATHITVAMTGMLIALPQTQLERRLKRENRLLKISGMDPLGLPNFITKTHPRNLLEQFRTVIGRSYDSEAVTRRMQYQLDLFESAEPHKRDIVRRELEFYALHLTAYAKEVVRESGRLLESRQLGGMVEIWEVHQNEMRSDPKRLVVIS